MTTGNATFTAGLVQMRASLSPQTNLDAAIRLIEQAKNAGAEYVLTPEMTNIFEIKRERLFATIAPEESRIARACTQAGHLPARRLVGHQGAAGEGGEPLVPHRPQG
jgi:predicted amidohydrolase